MVGDLAAWGIPREMQKIGIHGVSDILNIRIAIIANPQLISSKICKLHCNKNKYHMVSPIGIKIQIACGLQASPTAGEQLKMEMALGFGLGKHSMIA